MNFLVHHQIKYTYWPSALHRCLSWIPPSLFNICPKESLLSALLGHSLSYGHVYDCIFDAWNLVFDNFHILDVLLYSSEAERVCGKFHEERSYWTVPPALSLFPMWNSISNLCEIILNVISHRNQIIDQQSQFFGAVEITSGRWNEIHVLFDLWLVYLEL